MAELVAAKARVLGMGRERMVNLVRRVVVARGDDDKSRRETTKRRIAMKDIAYRNRLRLKIKRRFFFLADGSLSWFLR